MGTRSGAAVAAVVLATVLGAGSRTASADPKGEINGKVKEAMESYDLMDYDAAKKALNAAVNTAKKAKLDKDAVTARVWLDLGIVDFAAPDLDGAKAAFSQAVKIDPKIQIDAAYKSPEMAKLLDDARKHAKGGAAPAPTGDDPGSLDAVVGGDAGGGDAGADCGAVKGLQHNIIDSGHNNVPQPVEAMLGADVTASKVSLQYRAEGATEFSEVKLTKSGGCKFTGAIPAAATKGSIVHYYIAAYDANNKVIAAKGSAGSPNIMELTKAAGGGAALKSDEEDPLGKGGGGGGGGGGAGGGDVDNGVAKGVDEPGKPSKIILTVAGGTSVVYVSGNTENMNTVKNCCVGASLAVITPELDYAISPTTSIGVALRLGIPVGANFDGHATAAPSGLLRLRHSLSASGDGLRVMGEIGAGVLRETVKIDDPMNGMDTDIVSQGPLLIGAGIGYTKHLSNHVAFILDVSAIAGVAVTSSTGFAPILNSGIGADLSLGLAFGL